jgi:hypothetical protein
MKTSKLKIFVTREELAAIIIGLHEYLYLAEEGNLREALNEMDANLAEPASAAQTSDLLDRLRVAAE